MDESAVRLGDGRRLEFRSWGVADGHPLLLLHGTPGSCRWQPGPLGLAHLDRQRVHMVTASRPGYGSSDRVEGRSVWSFADDVAQLVALLGWGSGYSVLGVSGGGPHALACGVDVTGARAVAVLSGAGDFGTSSAYLGMLERSERLWRSALTADGALERLIVGLAPLLRGEDRFDVAARFVATFPDGDAALYAAEPALLEIMVEDVVQAFAGGGWGWLDDARALTSSWQFRVEHVAAPVRWWHGELDQFVPLHNAREIVGALPHAELVVRSAVAHVGLIESEFTAAIDWLIEQS